MKVQIILNYKDVETQVSDWAFDEDGIDFRKDLNSAEDARRLSRRLS